MSKPISVIKSLFRGDRAESGEAIISFAIVMPILMALSLAILEFSLVVMDYTRATEATRRAARIAAIDDPIADLTNIAGNSIVCNRNSGTLYCNGSTLLANTTFDKIVQNMQAVMPSIMPQNVEVVYSDSGVGTTASGGIKALVSVNLVDLKRPFMVLQVFAGIPSEITLPPFSATQITGGFIPP